MKTKVKVKHNMTYQEVTSIQRLTLVPETSNHLINIVRFGDDGYGGGVDDNNKESYKDWTALELLQSIIDLKHDLNHHPFKLYLKHYLNHHPFKL